MDTLPLILIALCLWVILSFALSPLIGRTIKGKPRFDPQDREQLGLLERQRAESAARVERALKRHNGKSA